MSVNCQDDRSNGREAQASRATSRQIEAAMRKATRAAIRRHKLLGESIAVSQDGNVVILAPEEIPDFPEDEESPAR